MDADSAMQLSRARSASLAQPQRPSLTFGHSHHSHTHPHPHPHSHSTGSPHMEHEHLMSMLSPHEEEEVLRAQGLPDTDGRSSLAGSSHHMPHPDLIESLNLGLSRSHHSLPPQHQHGLQLGNIGVDDTPYQPSMNIGSMFPPTTRLRLFQKLAGFANGHGNGNGNGAVSEGAPDELIPGLGEHSSTFVRKRQRKLSQSNTAHPRRQNKLALFEGAPPPTDTANNLTSQEAGVAAPPSNTGHDTLPLFVLLEPPVRHDSRQVAEERWQVDAYAYWGALTPEDPAKVKVRPDDGSKAKTSDEEEVCFRGFDQDPYSPTHLEPLNMYIIVFREGILSFHFRGTPHPQNVRRRIKQLKDYISVTSDWISYALIDDITDAFGPLIQGIEYEVDSIDELVLILKDTDQSDMKTGIGTCRKKVMGLLRLMGNKADVVKGLAKRCNENWSVAPKSDIVGYLSDIQVQSNPPFFTQPNQLTRAATGPLDHNDPESEPLRKDPQPLSQQLPRADFHRDDGREQPDQRRALEAHCIGNRPDPYELGYRSLGMNVMCPVKI
ncbi:CorA-like Mg2+ transporter protein [Rhizoctonia solani]|uniref:CorA-like Mg2+ transporter protein n=1 Tax=Rhizoctonia solani TaxID=456999 RepID=A0A8H7IM77_9AGAM|nr:CorA-like Mg2+ transporter protein [Rhizoctonia solani]